MSKIKGRDVLKVKVCFRTLVFEKERLKISINEIISKHKSCLANMYSIYHACSSSLYHRAIAIFFVHVYEVALTCLFCSRSSIRHFKLNIAFRPQEHKRS